ncbi:MAG: hypothetical protein A2Y17_01325 [Clostridiales bacterium GWF2_38_85]|nr:MAG: hypothetical protein A2Y17_01325 [Clostridiales bacterium GWF2_38_85]HBL85161.1 hypothetical protein [Clostridiales bacterium]
MKKLLSTILVVLISITAISSCKLANNESSAESGDTSVKNEKTDIDTLYTAEVDRSLEKLSVTQGKNYIVTAAASDIAELADDGEKLTDGKFSTVFDIDDSWSAFSYVNDIAITVDLGGVVDGISDFELDMLRHFNKKAHLADEIKVEVSVDGIEYTEVGVMNNMSGVGNLMSHNYYLKLNGGVSAKFIRFTLSCEQEGIAMIDEIGALKYQGEAEQREIVTYEPYYNGKMPEKVTEELFWSESEPDYATTQNLVAGLIPQTFTMRTDIDSESNSPVEDLYKLTDGKYANTASYADPALFWSAQANRATDARLFVFDLGKTSTITSAKTTFCHVSSAGVILPESYSVYASEDGVVWDVVYRRDGIRESNNPDNSLVSVVAEFEKQYKARFVAVFFDVEGHTRFDEIEVFGTKAIADNAIAVSENGDTKLRTGEWPTADDLNGVHDILLMFHCYSNTIVDGVAPAGGFDVDHFLKLMAYYDKNMKITDTMFDTFLFIPGGGTMTWTNAARWKAYYENLFSEGYNLDAMNQAAAQVQEALGDENYKGKVMFPIFLASNQYTQFGDLDGDGIDENFNTLENKSKAIKWVIDEYLRRFNEGNYENLEVVGFYFESETIDYTDVNCPASMRYAADYVHELGYMIMSCPYYMSSGYYDFYNLGFDAAFKQPSYYFWNNQPEAFPRTCTTAKWLGMSTEMEVEPDANTDSAALAKYIEYLRAGVDYGYMNATHMYYYSVPYYQSIKSGTARGRLIYDLTYKFIKHKLIFSTVEKDYETIFTGPADTKITGKIEADGMYQDIGSSTRYGNIKFERNGKFTYTPKPGFAGEDSFTVIVNDGGEEKTLYTVKIKVE